MTAATKQEVQLLLI